MSSHKSEDLELLRKFSETGNQSAFRALVERYTGLVYGVALRRTGDAHLSEEIAQNVFLILARKANGLSIQRSLGAWLHRVTILESLDQLGKEASRQRHLSMIREQQEHRSESEKVSWGAIRPLLDQLLNRLSTRDREILILHYIEGLKFSEVAQRVGMSPAAAQKRSVRALGKISGYLKRYGVVASTAFLTKGLQAEVASTAPAGLAGKIGGVSLATASAATTTGALTTILATMTTSKLPFVVTFLVSALTPTILMSLGSEVEGGGSRRVDKVMVTPARSALPRRVEKSFDREEFRQLLHKLNQNQDEDLVAERKRALQRLMFTLELDEVKDAVAILNEALLSFEQKEKRPSPPRVFEENLKAHLWGALADILQAGYSRWAEMEPQEAVASASDRKHKGSYYAMSGAWDTWAFADWEAAFAWKIEHNLSYSLGDFLDRQAVADGPLAIERANALTAAFPKDKEDYLMRVLGVWSMNEPQLAIEWMDENLIEPVRRDELIGHTLESLGEYYPAQALDQLGLIRNEARVAETRYNVFMRWSSLKPMEAVNYFEQSGGVESWDISRVRNIGLAISSNDHPDRALEIARTIQDEKRRDLFYSGILMGTTESAGSEALEAANEIGIDGIRANWGFNSFLEKWAERDRGAAEAWVEALPAGPKKEWAKDFLPRKK